MFSPSKLGCLIAACTSQRTTCQNGISLKLACINQVQPVFQTFHLIHWCQSWKFTQIQVQDYHGFWEKVKQLLEFRKVSCTDARNRISKFLGSKRHFKFIFNVTVTFNEFKGQSTLQTNKHFYAIKGIFNFGSR